MAVATSYSGRTRDVFVWSPDDEGVEEECCDIFASFLIGVTAVFTGSKGAGLERFGVDIPIVWCSMVWYGMVWYGMVWYDI